MKNNVEEKENDVSNREKKIELWRGYIYPLYCSCSHKHKNNRFDSHYFNIY